MNLCLFVMEENILNKEFLIFMLIKKELCGEITTEPINMRIGEITKLFGFKFIWQPFITTNLNNFSRELSKEELEEIKIRKEKIKEEREFEDRAYKHLSGHRSMMGRRITYPMREMEERLKLY